MAIGFSEAEKNFDNGTWSDLNRETKRLNLGQNLFLEKNGNVQVQPKAFSLDDDHKFQ